MDPDRTAELGTAEPALADGGIETTLLFIEQLSLPCFATFPLLEDEDGRAAMTRYYTPYLDTAAAMSRAFVLGTTTWRATPDWGARLGYSKTRLGEANRRAVAFAENLATGRPAVTLNGVLGPRGDGYLTGERMTLDEAGTYHDWQIRILRDAGVERITAMTMTYPEEAAGIVQAAADLSVPVVVSFTVETDGRLPSGISLADAIGQVDAMTGSAARFFMVNCAHPSHIAAGLDTSDANARIGGLRVNASALSHAELESATELDDGDPESLAHDTASLRAALPSIELLGGCCGTDHRHITALATAWNA